MTRTSALGLLASTFLLGSVPLVACGAGRDGFGPTADAGAEGGAAIPDGGFGTIDAGDGGPLGETRDPVDCEEAKTSKSYVGCDYWPTVTPNMVWSIFDYAVVVANTGAKEASVTVTGPNGVDKTVTVPAGELRKIYLPWVPELKGADIDECSMNIPLLDASVVVPHGAYHLVSSTPVIVYQFNALQYQATGGEAPDGGAKDWSTCPANACSTGLECLSFTNDASLLLPSTAMTNNYRVTAFTGYPTGPTFPGSSAAISVTATQPNTTVTLTLSPTATLLASTTGPTIPAAQSGTVTITLAEAGDVAELVGGKAKDFSGSLVQSDKPVQVISSDPCISIPLGKPSCDHLEETVLPAETLGKHYVVVPPTGPKGQAVGQLVRFFGNQDNTKLTYKPAKPSACPLVLKAGQVVECDVITDSFEVQGDKEFGVTTFLLGNSQYQDERGDPSQTNVVAVEQFRTKYVFLAPDDYPVQWADIVAEEGSEILLDGQPIAAPWNSIGSGIYGVHRADLTKSGKAGAHTLTAKKPVGVQVTGHGKATSFQYPAGLNLTLISAPPPPPK